MTSADRLYQSRLVHVAASHWLAKTRRRQQLRLQIALEKQALTSIAQLARVALYARRWRHLARMRRAEREGSQHRALLDGWAARNVSVGWRGLPKTGPSGLRRADVSMTSAQAVRKGALAVSAGLENLPRVAPTPAKAGFASKREYPEKVAALPVGNNPKTTALENTAFSAPPVRSSTEAGLASVGAAGAGPVSTIVERITASIASGASVLDALPPWARAHSRPPPRRPNHLLTAGKPRAPAGIPGVTAANSLETRSEAERQVSDPRQRTGAEGTVGLDSGVHGNRPGFDGELGSGSSLKNPLPRAMFSPTTNTPASSQATRVESSFPGDGGASGGASDSREEIRTPEFVRCAESDAGPLFGGELKHGVYRKVAVSRQLVLGASVEAHPEVSGAPGGETFVRENSSGKASRGSVHILGGRRVQESGPGEVLPGPSKPDDIRPMSPGALLPVGGLTSNARVIAQEVTWMEAVLRDFDDLKAQSSECSKSLHALREAADSGESRMEAGGKEPQLGPRFAEGLSRAERIWELEQRHAALELRKKLQLPMVKAVAERIRSMALASSRSVVS